MGPGKFVFKFSWNCFRIKRYPEKCELFSETFRLLRLLSSGQRGLHSIMNMMTVATFDEKDAAENLRLRLQEAGIQAEIYDESKLQRFWFLSKPHADKKIRVEEKDFDKARELLVGLDAQEHVLDLAVTCPKCHSSRIEYPHFTRKFVVPTVIEIFSIMAPGMKRQFFCEDCQHTWTLEPEVQPQPWDGSGDLDSLGWKKKEEKAD